MPTSISLRRTAHRTALLLAAALAVPSASAAQQASSSCSALLAPPRMVDGTRAGQDGCHLQDRGVVESRSGYRRLDIGVDGTLAGWIVKQGPRSNHFSTAPELVFGQSGNPGPWVRGVLRYDAARGTGLTLVHPERGWNGKLFVTAHGGTGSFRRGSMKAWDQTFDAAAPLADLSRYETSMLAKGYAVAVTRRNAQVTGPGDFSATLADGSEWPDQNVGMVAELILDMGILAERVLEDRLGRRPSRTYFYGFSGGALTGMLANYPSGLNRHANGEPVFDGFIWDDPAGGLLVPVLERDGRDVLFATDAEREGFAKTIELAHLLYDNAFTAASAQQMDLARIPEWVSPDYLANKATRVDLLGRKGMGERYRMYGVAGVSHSGGEYDEGEGASQTLPLWRLVDGVVDQLDAWVERGVAPPPSRFPAPAAAANGQGAPATAVHLPETACPLGVYHQYPADRGNGGVTATAFVPFEGGQPEPVDGRNQPVDMNANGRPDARETVTEAWVRLGLLPAGGTFDRGRYVACVRASAGALRDAGFITAAVAEQYLREAESRVLPDR